jgi:molecular chaperone DnaK
MFSWLTSLWSWLNRGVEVVDDDVPPPRVAARSSQASRTGPAAAKLPEPVAGLDWDPRPESECDDTLAPPLPDEVPDGGPVLGIDLGTTHSAVAVLSGGRVEVIPNPEGEPRTPSVVAFTEDGGVLVGAAALRQAALNPRRTVYSLKRCFDRDAGNFGVTTPYEIVTGPDGAPRVRIDDRLLTPAEIAAHLLRRLLDDAAAHLGRAVRRAVLTVPASFDDGQRQAMLDAALLAGLDVQWVLQDPDTGRRVVQPMRVISEPTAAALAHGRHRRCFSWTRTVAVVHAGGGAFDVSVLVVGDGIFEVRAVSGDAALGGDDFDHLLVCRLAEGFAARAGRDPRREPAALWRLKEAAEQAKRDLSQAEAVRVRLPCLLDGADLDQAVTRAEFERLAEGLLARCRALVLRALADAKYKPREVDEVLLLGGMTRMPRLRALVREAFGRDPVALPDESVATGAAVQGAQLLLCGRSDLVLLDVAPLTLGVEAAGGAFTVLIERNTMIPCEKRRVFTTARDDQPGVSVRVYQCDDAAARNNRLLAQLDLDGLPPGPRGSVRVEVTFDMDHNGVLRVTAAEPAAGREKTMRVARARQLSAAEAARLRRDAERNAERHSARRALLDARQRAAACLHRLEELLRGARGLDPADAAPLRSQEERLRRLTSGDDAGAIDDAARATELASEALAAWLAGRRDAAVNAGAFPRVDLEL